MRRMRSTPALIAPLLITVAAAAAAAADNPAPDFLREVRPILAEHCLQCHGPDEAERAANLRLDQPDDALALLPSGNRAIIPGDPASSELIRRITSDDPDEIMPPPDAKRPLSDEQKQVLQRWIDHDAPYARHWAFQRIDRPAAPELDDSSRIASPIDRFIHRRLVENGLQSAPEADRRTLIRRLSLDLTGLPPDPSDVEEFVADEAPDAYSRLVDRLLASPHYGEKMAQGWLDLARFGDSSGYQDDGDRPSWPYRDYVIRAFNDGMPFDRFTIENLAGDLLPDPTIDQQIASGFNRLHRHNEEGGSDEDEFRVVYTVDRVNTTAATWLGLTFGCAQCHDHKYDPFTQREFYEFFAFFNSIDGEVVINKNNRECHPFIRVPTDAEQRKRDSYVADINSLEQQIAPLKPAADAALAAWITEQSAIVTTAGDESSAQSGGKDESLTVEQILALPESDRTDAHHGTLRTNFLSNQYPKLAALEEQLSQARNERATFEKRLPVALVWREMAEPRPAYLLARGDYQQPREQVERDVPSVFPPLSEDVPRDRLALARWLVSPDHPLTSRVAANRIWQQFFGAGLVHTPEDFGTRGELPTHPELLDWLAAELIDTGWEFKRVQRSILLSHTYRQTSAVSPEQWQADPENRLCSHGARFRLSAEEVRDVALAACGLLVEQLGGPSTFPYQNEVFYREKEDFPGEWQWPQKPGPQLYRRGMYTFWRRTTPYPPFTTFDAPSRGECTVMRSRTNTPLQALITLNDPTFVEAARVLAERIMNDGGPDPSSKLTFAFLRCLSRPPSEAESEVMLSLYKHELARYGEDPHAATALIKHGSAAHDSAGDPAETAAWISIATTLLNLDESITRE